MLYYGIGKYISLNSRNCFWGKGAIEAISERLDKELPGLRGFTSRNLRYMRTFYEEWKMLDAVNSQEQVPDNASDNLEIANSKMPASGIMPIWKLHFSDRRGFPLDAFWHIGFTHHCMIFVG